MSSKFLIPASSQVEISDVVGLQDELDEIEAQIAGGGGGGVDFSITSDVINNGMVFRNNSDLDKIQDTTDFKLIEVLGNKLLSVPDILLPSRLFLSVGDSINANKTKLTKITYDDTTDPQHPFTKIEGELDVDKIKNTDHTAEIEFEDTGLFSLSCGDAITMKATAFDFKDIYDTQTSTRGVQINIDGNLSKYEISCPDWNMFLSNVYRINGTTPTTPDYIELDNAGIKLKTNNNSSGIIIESNIGVNITGETGGVNITGETGIVMSSNLNNIENKTNNLITFEDLGASNGVMTINPATQEINFKKNNNLYGTIGLNASNDTIISANNKLKLGTMTGDIEIDATGDIEINATNLLTTQNTPTTDACIMNKISTIETIDTAIRDFPAVTSERIPKTPSRPVAGTTPNPVYEDEILKLGWDSGGADLEVLFKTGSNDYNSYCYKPGTTSLTKRQNTTKNQKIDLNAFTFSGGNKMVTDLVVLNNSISSPRYLISVFWTEDSIGIDGDLHFRIEKYLNEP